jgi:hypothetical protein
MNWRSVTFVALNVGFFAWNICGAVTHAQVPATNREGVPFLNVNINPTGVPPVVDINPGGRLPRVAATVVQPVEISKLPDVRVLRSGCDDPNNFDTEVARNISGPLRVTFLSMPASTAMNLDSNGRTYRVPFNPANQMGSTIELHAGQQLQFDTDVMFSGCRP